jgi:hypothetical protein
MLKLSQSIFGVCKSLLLKNVYNCYAPDPNIKHNAEMTMRAARRTFLNKAVLNQKKTVYFGEMRKTSDTVLALKQAGRCPGVIMPYSGLQS